jgi:hypothetical protein
MISERVGEVHWCYLGRLLTSQLLPFRHVFMFARCPICRKDLIFYHRHSLFLKQCSCGYENVTCELPLKVSGLDSGLFARWLERFL